MTNNEDMIETWKDIQDYEGLYQVSDLGRVKSCGRLVNDCRGQVFKDECILRQLANNKGYSYIRLCKNAEVKRFYVHRLVAAAFIPNPDKLPEVNHKDENPQNNSVSNLEWCTHSYNNSYGSKGERQATKVSSGKVAKIKDGVVIEVYRSAEYAGKLTGINPEQIRGCLKKKYGYRTAGGYTWEYVN